MNNNPAKIFERASETPAVSWIQDFKAILDSIQTELKIAGFDCRYDFRDSSATHADMHVSGKGVSHSFEIAAEGQRTLGTMWRRWNMEEYPKIFVSVPGEARFNAVPVSIAEYNSLPEDQRTQTLITGEGTLPFPAPAWRALNPDYYQAFQTFGLDDLRLVPVDDVHKTIASFMAESLGDLKREQKFETAPSAERHSGGPGVTWK